MKRNYLRLKHTCSTFGESDAFKHIVLVPNNEGNDQLVILVPRASQTETTVLAVQSELRNMKVIEENSETRNVWVPRFKQEQCQLASFKGIKVSNDLQVQQSVEAANFELFAPKQSKGNIQL